MSVSRGNRVRAVGGIGGGYGDPMERPEDAVLADVLDGYLTIEEAGALFGVVIEQGRVNLEATQRQRQAAK